MVLLKVPESWKEESERAQIVAGLTAGLGGYLCAYSVKLKAKVKVLDIVTCTV